jgi:hypothetical protein
MCTAPFDYRGELNDPPPLDSIRYGTIGKQITGAGTAAEIKNPYTVASKEDTRQDWEKSYTGLTLATPDALDAGGKEGDRVFVRSGGGGLPILIVANKSITRPQAP